MPDIAIQENASQASGHRVARAKAFITEAFAEGRPEAAVQAHTGARFVQHSTGVKDGKAGFTESITGHNRRFPDHRIQIVRAWEDDRLVFLHILHNLNDGEREYVTTEFFDTDDDGKLVEHWSVMGDFKGPNPSGRTQVDGKTAISDLDRTEANKAIVQTMLRESVFPGARPDSIERFFGKVYLQHNPGLGDGLEIVRELSQAENPQLVYHEIVLTVGRGNFVAVLCKSSWAGAPLAQVDILRLEDGKIVEHWDLNEPAAPSDVNSGKF